MEEQFDLIEKYLQGNLSGVERAIFEDRMARDPELRALVQQHRLEQQAQELLVEEDLFSKMRQWDAAAQTATPLTVTAAPMRVRRTAWQTALPWAAVFLLFGAAGWWLATRPAETDAVTQTTPTKPHTAKPKTLPMPNRTQPTPAVPKAKQPNTLPTQITDEDMEEAVTAAPTPPPVISSPSPAYMHMPPDYAALAATAYEERDFMRSSLAARSTDVLYLQALEQYKSGNFNEVTRLLQATLSLSSAQRELFGHALYRKGDYAAAAEHFRTLTGARDAALSQRSDWAFVLALLPQLPTKRPLFDRALQKITDNPAHAFYEKAVRLHAQLEGK